MTKLYKLNEAYCIKHIRSFNESDGSYVESDSEILGAFKRGTSFQEVLKCTTRLANDGHIGYKCRVALKDISWVHTHHSDDGLIEIMYTGQQSQNLYDMHEDEALEFYGVTLHFDLMTRGFMNKEEIDYINVEIDELREKKRSLEDGEDTAWPFDKDKE